MVIRASRPGTSLVEAEIALLILAIGLLSIVPLAVRLLAQVREAVDVERSTTLAVTVLDSLAQLQRPAAGRAVTDGVALDWTAVPWGSTVRIELHANRLDDRGLHSDTLVTFAGPWPRRLHALP